MKTITLDVVDIDTLIKCLNYVKDAYLAVKSLDTITNSNNDKIISRIDYVLNKIQ